MKILFYELNKILFKQKALIFIIIGVCIKIIFLFLSSSYSVETTNQNKIFYKQYLLTINGELTPNKEKYIENEQTKINKMNSEKAELTNKYLKEQISNSEYVLRITEINNSLKKSDSFKILYDQYSYIKNDPNNRYFLYTNGWTNLLADEKPDLLLILLILVIITPIFTNEYEKDMVYLILTSKKGKTSVPTFKIIAGSLVTLFLVISFSLIQYFFYDIKYSLPSGDFPLQSIAFFGTSKYHLSLISTYLYICLIRLIGFLVFTFMIIFISVVLKKTLTVLFTSLSIILIPYFIYFNESIKYTLPLPIGFIIGNGYFRGTVSSNKLERGATSFIEVSKHSFTSEFIYMLVLTLLFVIGTIFVFSKFKGIRRHKSL